ncbi:MAG TPA: SRPBCC family protein, partial [Polyangiaceae bacterium]|nr:SRPBCC family protein [Polyangiaceae bacterium]
FSASCRGLREVRVDVLHGFVFVCLGNDTAELGTSLAGAPEWLQGSELDLLRLGRAVSYEVAANWKICVENFQESHHFERVHPGLQRQTPSAGASSWKGSGGWLGGLMQLASHASTVAAEPRSAGESTEPAPKRPWIVPPEDRRRVADAFAFPTLLTSLQPDYLLTYRLQPLGPARTGVVAATYFHMAAFAPEPWARDVYEFWDQVNAEDRAICERQQRGVQSRSYEPACYSLVEDGVHAFDQMVARSYLQT